MPTNAHKPHAEATQKDESCEPQMEMLPQPKNFPPQFPYPKCTINLRTEC